MNDRKMRVPGTISELSDLLATIVLRAPELQVGLGFPSYRNLNYIFTQLTLGLDANRARLGEARFLELTRMKDEVRALFEADPDDKTGEMHRGCLMINDMDEILRTVPRSGRSEG